MVDKRRTNKKETKMKRCTVWQGGGGASNRKLQRSPLKWDGNRTRVCSLTHLSPELNLEAASNPRQHFIGSLVISLPFAASSLQFFPPFPLSFAPLLVLFLLLGLVNEPKRVFVSAIERRDPRRTGSLRFFSCLA